MRVEFLQTARQELDDGFTWYEEQVPGLGYEFLDEIDRAVGRVAAYPRSAGVVAKGLRRVLLGRFPYGVIYGLDSIPWAPERIRRMSAATLTGSRARSSRGGSR
jgi:hypothetical protein